MVDSVITLFDSSSTDFSNNGLGNLPDVISCFITEELNGSYELEMVYPVTGKRYNDILLRRIIVSKPNPYSSPQPFRIYAITKPIDGIVTINAEHISYDLSGYPVAPFSAGIVTNALSSLKKASVLSCPFIFQTDKTNTGNIDVKTPKSIRAVLGGDDNSILGVYGGEYEFDGYNVRLWNKRGSNRGVSIRYGKNLTDLEQEENCSAVYTGVYPFWYSEEQGLVYLKNKYVSTVGTYGFTRIYPLDLSSEWDEPPSEDKLRAKALDYISVNKLGVPKVSLTVSFIQLAQSEEYKDFALLENVYLGDIVSVEFPELNVSATARCVKTKYDAVTGKYSQIELGESKSDLVSTISEQSKKISEVVTKSFLEKAVDNATKLITGGLGGYVLLHSSTGGSCPDEILIMDTDDIQTASKVWRWNSGGLGYSATGYNGPYALAMTMDGAIVANFIAAGTLNGALLKAGSVEASSLSVDYKQSVVDRINGVTTSLTQAFKAADGELLSSINSKFSDYSTKAEVTSTISQLADKISLVVSSTEGTNKIKAASIVAAINNDSSVTISADRVNLNGYVTFSGLSTKGKTSICGDNITTGKISADRIDVSALKVQKLYTYSSDYKVALTSVGVDSLYIGGDGSWGFADLYLYATNSIILRRYSAAQASELEFDLDTRSIHASNSYSWDLGNLIHPFFNIYCSNGRFDKIYVDGEEYNGKIQKLYIESTGRAVEFTYRSSNSSYAFESTSSSYLVSLGSSIYPWASAHLTKLYLNGTEFLPSEYMKKSDVSTTPSVTATDIKKIYANGYTNKYVELTISLELVPNGNGFSLGTSTYPWKTAYITELYLNGSKFDPSSSSSGISETDVYRIYAKNYTSKYIELGASGDFVPNSTGFALGSTSYPFTYGYFGSTSYYLKMENASIIPNTSTSLTTYYNLGSQYCPFNRLYVKELSANDTILLGSSYSTSKIGFFGADAVIRQTLSTTYANMSYSSATASNYLTILNNIAGILKKYGLIG